MKATVDQTVEERAHYRAMYAALQRKLHGINVDEFFVGFRRSSAYSHYTFSGEVSDALIFLLGRMPTSDELIMIVDHGYNNCGATCSFYGKCFYGQVNVR